MAKNSFDSIANSFHKAEQGMGGSNVMGGRYELDQSGTKPMLGIKRPQSPAQHASVKKAGAASASKRKAGAGFGGKAGNKVFGF